MYNPYSSVCLPLLNLSNSTLLCAIPIPSRRVPSNVVGIVGIVVEDEKQEQIDFAEIGRLMRRTRESSHRIDSVPERIESKYGTSALIPIPMPKK